MKQIESLHRGAPPHWVGDGFPVRGTFGDRAFTPDISPFLLLDYAGPADFVPASAPRGVGQHPHRGFETVTIVYQGDVEHQDSAGNRGTIGPGDVQWMTAAGGILHEEWHGPELTANGGTLEMAQLWVNLPARAKSVRPGYQALLAADIPTVPLPEGAGSVRVVAGDFEGTKGPARTFTPVDVWDVRLAAGRETDLPLPEGAMAAFYVRRGEVAVGKDVAREGDLVLLTHEGEDVHVEARRDAELLLVGGEPIPEPIASYGPFVMNTREEIGQAIADFQAGRFGG